MQLKSGPVVRKLTLSLPPALVRALAIRAAEGGQNMSDCAASLLGSALSV